MMAERVVHGIPEAIENLKKYQLIKVQAVKDRLKKQAFKVELLAKEMVSVKKARLKSSISTNWAGSSMAEGKTGPQAEGGDGVKRPEGSKELLYVVGSNVKYAPYQEFGTKRMSARPYLFPAYFSYEGETIKALAIIMKEDVRLG
jgi:phage gpG-like protein